MVERFEEYWLGGVSCVVLRRDLQNRFEIYFDFDIELTQEQVARYLSTALFSFCEYKQCS